MLDTRTKFLISSVLGGITSAYTDEHMYLYPRIMFGKLYVFEELRESITSISLLASEG